MNKKERLRAAMQIARKMRKMRGMAQDLAAGGCPGCGRPAPKNRASQPDGCLVCGISVSVSGQAR